MNYLLNDSRLFPRLRLWNGREHFEFNLMDGRGASANEENQQNHGQCMDVAFPAVDLRLFQFYAR